jgi:hypothetical protein
VAAVPASWPTPRAASAKWLLGANLRGPIGDHRCIVSAALPPVSTRRRSCRRSCWRRSRARLSRLTSLRRRIDGRRDTLTDWLEHDIAQVTVRLDWFRRLGESL